MNEASEVSDDAVTLPVPDAADGERRELTILFADIVGSTALGERLGEDLTYSVTRSLFAEIVPVVESRHGTVAEFTGDGLMAIFGAPVALDNAALVACRAALAISERLKELGPSLLRRHGICPDLRLGINTGLAVVGRLGMGRNIDLTAIGDAVNLAARLQQLAEPGSIVIGEATREAVQGFTDVTPLGERKVRGRSKALAIYRLNSVRDDVSRFEGGRRTLTPFVGRSAEVDRLLALSEEARTGAVFVNIVGDAGIGKSRVVSEFLERADPSGSRRLCTHSLPDSPRVPYFPFVILIRRALGVGDPGSLSATEPYLAERLSLLGVAGPGRTWLLSRFLGLPHAGEDIAGTDATLIGIRTRDLIYEVMTAILTAGDRIITFEDIHWMDGPSARLLQLLVKEATAPLLVICTQRPDPDFRWEGPTGGHTLVLDALDSRDLESMIALRLGHSSVPSALTSMIDGKAEGNPLFVEEIVSLLIDRGDIAVTRSGIRFTASDATALPPSTIQGIVLNRVDRLPLATKGVLQIASVIGRRFTPRLLALATGLPVNETLDLIRHSGLINASDTSDAAECAFRHELVRDALYEALLADDRMRLHLKVARAIESQLSDGGDSVSNKQLVHHYSRTTARAKAFEYAAASGQDSLATYALEEADRYFGLAMSIVEATPAEVPDRMLARMLGGWMRVLELMGRLGDIRQHAERQLPRLRAAVESPEVVFVLFAYSHALAHGHLFAEADVLAAEAEAVAARIGDAPGAARAGLVRMMVHEKTRSGRFEDDRAQTLGREVLRVARDLPDGSLEMAVLFELSNDLMHRGFIPEARASLANLEAAGRRRGDPRAISYASWAHGWLDLHEARFPSALARGEESSLRALTRTDALVALSVTGTALAMTGQPGRAWTSLSLVYEEAERNLDRLLSGPAMASLGLAAVAGGRIGRGLALIKRAIRRAEAENYPALAAFGRLMLGEVYVEIAVGDEKPTLGQVIRNLPALIRVLPFAARRGEALLSAIESSRQFAIGGVATVRISLALGRLATRRRQHETARRELDKARTLAGALGVDSLVALADRALAKLEPYSAHTGV